MGDELWYHSVNIVSGANMATDEEIHDCIKDLCKLMGTGYYDDRDGDILFQQIIDYLNKKLEVK